MQIKADFDINSDEADDLFDTMLRARYPYMADEVDNFEAILKEADEAGVMREAQGILWQAYEDISDMNCYRSRQVKLLAEYRAAS